MQQRVVSESKTCISEEGIVAAAMEIVPAGSLMYSFKLSVGKVAFAGKDLHTNEAIFSVLPSPAYDLTYFYFALPELLMHSAGQNIYGAKIFNQELLKNAFISLPPLAEQRAIARFLDDKTAQLDHLLTQKQQMLALLREERAALLNHAVTQGLDAAAPRRDSGVEWLGEVPAHWEVKRLKHITSLIQTGPFGSQLHAEDYVDNGIPVINPAHLQDGLIVPSQKVTVSDETRDKLDRHILAEGDIVFARRGEMGRCALVTQESAGWLCGTGSLKVILVQSLVLPEFLFKVLSNYGIRELLSLESVGSTMENLNTDILSRIQLPLPSVEEQQEVVDYLHRKEQELQ